MSHVLISIIGFLIAIGILVTVHEFGHFFVARRFGVKVLRFSIGFGHPFFRWYDKSGTEYVLSTLPFGGYVALYGEKEAFVEPSLRHMAFCYKTVWARICILLAGPLFNLGFAVIAYWLMFMIGITSLAPILGTVPNKTPAEIAGLHARQEIISVEHKPVHSWEGVSVALISAVGENKSVNVEVKEFPNGKKTTHTVDISGVEHGKEAEILKELGLHPLDPLPPIIGKVLPGYPAEHAGIKPGDLILAVDHHPVYSRTEASEVVQVNLNKTIAVTIKRGNEKRDVQLQPVAKELDDGRVAGFMGVIYRTEMKPPPEYVRIQKYGPVDAFIEGSKRTWNYTILTFQMLKKMIVGTVSIKNISGPISIAQYAGQTVTIGIEYFLSFLAVVSISLGVLNLLPIPILDGGHVMYCLFELISGRRVSDAAQNVGIWIGGMIILAVTLVAIYNDLARF